MPPNVTVKGKNAPSLISADGAPPQTPLEELTALPRPPAVFKGPTSKGREGVKGKEGKKRGENRRTKGNEGEGRGMDMPDQCQTSSYAPV